MKLIVFTLWAAVEGDADGVWMLAAEDEHAWENDPDRCEGVFEIAKRQAADSGFVTREVNLVVDTEKVSQAFWATEIDADVEEA